MPYPNEHAARQQPPSKYKRHRRENEPDGFPKGISVIWGVPKDGSGTEIQSIRADRKRWTPDRFRKWLEEHDFKTNVEDAANKALTYYDIIKA